MTKKILIGLGITLVALVSFYFYQRFTFEYQLNQKIKNFSEQQKNQVQNDISNSTSEANQIQKNVSDKIGIPLPSVNNQNIKNSIVDARAVAADAGIKSSLQSLASTAKMYIINHQNYGISDSDNICGNSGYDSFMQIIKNMNNYTTTPASCNTSYFPSKTFTVVAQSPANKIYCIDQNGTIVTLEMDNNFIAGEKCK